MAINIFIILCLQVQDRKKTSKDILLEFIIRIHFIAIL